MSIPLDRLYHFIENIAKEINDNIIIYRFYPYGSKKLEDLVELCGPNTWQTKVLGSSIWCYDQEPLNYELYQHRGGTSKFADLLRSVGITPTSGLPVFYTIYGKGYLLHSEKRSEDVIKYQNSQVIPIYYWSHALIALDWFRFAQHIKQKKQIKNIFLIYSRAWSGTREYRLKFAELLIGLNLQTHCKTSVNPIEPELGIHYSQHLFDNPSWRPLCILEDHFPTTTATSHYSADFNIDDYESTDIEVILETLFDDDRLHLTEKSLRPIACGQPFILAGTYGSLEYLRSYGFKTFNNIWNEQYDNIEDPQERLVAIADLMKTISNWSLKEKSSNLAKAQAITDYNKKHFFSEEFFNQVITELKNNLQLAINQVRETNNFKPFIDRWEHFLAFKEINNFLENPLPGEIHTKKQVETVLKIAKDLYQQQLTNQQKNT